MTRPRLHQLWLALLLGASGLLITNGVSAAVVVVMSADGDTEQLSKSQVINIFLGRDRELPDGTKAIPVDLPANNPAKAEFYRVMVNKDLDQMAAYWSRFVFAGSTTPPYQATDIPQMIRFLANHPGAVGYLNSSIKDPRIKVVLRLE